MFTFPPDALSYARSPRNELANIYVSCLNSSEKEVGWRGGGVENGVLRNVAHEVYIHTARVNDDCFSELAYSPCEIYRIARPG